jgi:hypothetical protein
VPAMAIIFGSRTSASALWIGSANALRLGTARGTFNFRCHKWIYMMQSW